MQYYKDKSYCKNLKLKRIVFSDTVSSMFLMKYSLHWKLSILRWICFTSKTSMQEGEIQPHNESTPSGLKAVIDSSFFIDHLSTGFMI